MNNAGKKVISNIFRDLTKLTMIALVVGQFVPGREFSFSVFFGGIISAVLMAVVAVRFAVDEKEVAL